MPSIAGQVTIDGAPAGGVYVRLVGPSGEFVSERYTGDDGRFTFHVAPGAWRLEARAAGARRADRTVEVGPGNGQAVVSLELSRG
jgi:hypothetical protein